MSSMYREEILELYKHPENKGQLASPTHVAQRNNPLCGDKIAIHLVLEGGHIEDVRFDGESCAICTASASLITDAIKGKTKEEVISMDSEHIKTLLGTTIHPARMKCALLPLETIQEALTHDHTA